MSLTLILVGYTLTWCSCFWTTARGSLVCFLCELHLDLARKSVQSQAITVLFRNFWQTQGSLLQEDFRSVGHCGWLQNEAGVL